MGWKDRKRWEGGFKQISSRALQLSCSLSLHTWIFGYLSLAFFGELGARERMINEEGRGERWMTDRRRKKQVRFGKFISSKENSQSPCA